MAGGTASLTSETVQSNTAMAGGGGQGYLSGGPGTAAGGRSGHRPSAPVSISLNTDISGNTPDQNTVIDTATLTVTPDEWTSAGLTLTLANDDNLHVSTTGTTTDAVPPVTPASVTNIAIASPSGAATSLTIDSTAGDPVPTGNLNYSGDGGLIVTGSGSVTLSAPNSYTGGTTVSTGTLLVDAATALPTGGSLAVGASGTFVFDPTAAAGSATVAAAPSSVPTTTDGRVRPVSGHPQGGSASAGLPTAGAIATNTLPPSPMSSPPAAADRGGGPDPASPLAGRGSAKRIATGRRTCRRLGRTRRGSALRVVGRDGFCLLRHSTEEVISATPPRWGRLTTIRTPRTNSVATTWRSWHGMRSLPNSVDDCGSCWQEIYLAGRTSVCRL